MVYGRNSNGDAIVVAVEGKADEPFGPRVWTWVRGDEWIPSKETTPRPTRLARLEFLCKQLGSVLPADSELRYQLLHRTVSAVLEAKLHGAAAALVLIHAFGPECHENRADYVKFIHALGAAVDAPIATVTGPVTLAEERDLPTYFLWWQSPVKHTRDA